MALKKIVYLLGAGATHAEILNLGFPDEVFLSKNGLLISYVSKRVMNKAQNNARFKKDVKEVTYRAGPVNIELLISLIASQRIPDADFKANYLKQLVQNDITRVLSKWKKALWLHKALFELHWLVKKEEEVTAVISLNYDDVLDEAYTTIFRKDPNYCHTSIIGQGFPLLKLHGSFNWTKIKTYGKSRTIPIIPLGINKNYLIPPYNFIWGRALEELSRCDTLRIVGCSLNQNDIGLVDLLFKAHLERNAHMEIQIINSQEEGERVKRDYGFFPKIITLKDIEGSLIPDNTEGSDPEVNNPFKIWLRAKARQMLEKRINRTKYLKRIL
ncbi:MAG: hypothetical protein ABSA44_02310 [Bacteroidota bacterium]|jgi:hypothetical protein